MKKIIFLAGISSALLFGASGSVGWTSVNGQYSFSGSFSYDILSGEFSASASTSSTSNDFNVTDVNKNHLSTKIANKVFNVTLKNNQNYVGVVMVDMIKTPANQTECETNLPLMGTTRFIVVPNMKEVNFSDSYYDIDKNVTFRVIYMDNFYENCGVTFSVTNPTAEQIYQCFVDNENYVKVSCNSDNFAIRPDHFKIKVDTPQPIKAGNDFNVTLTAYDYTNNIITSYNEPVSIKGLSALLDYVDANTSKGAITGKLSFADNQAHSFVNGEANLTLRYSEVGDLNLTIKETNDTNTYAYVDRNDTSLNQLVITPSSTLITFIPDHFDINATYKNFHNSDFTYISSDLNMSSVLDVNITAKNAQDDTTKNYNKQCYAKNFDMNISHSIPSELSKDNLILYKIENGKEYNVTLDKDLNFTNLSKNYFSTDNNGSAIFNVYINFEKNYTNPVNPFDFNVTEINVSDEDNVTGTQKFSENATFRYGRITLKNTSVFGKDINTTFKYEYWTDAKGWIVNKEHNVSSNESTPNFGDVNISKSIYPSNIKLVRLTQNGKDILEGNEDMNISTTHSLPYGAKIHLSIPSWLWYNPLAKPYKDPTSSNKDCLTHPCLDVQFLSNSTGWGGISGIDVEEFNATKRTVKVDSNSNSGKASNKGTIRLNW